jgi:hypothetical protein
MNNACQGPETLIENRYACGGALVAIWPADMVPFVKARGKTEKQQKTPKLCVQRVIAPHLRVDY